MSKFHPSILLSVLGLVNSPLNAAVTALSGLDSVEMAKQHTNPLKIWTLLQEHGWKSTVYFGASISQGNSENSLVTAGFTLDVQVVAIVLHGFAAVLPDCRPPTGRREPYF